MGRLTSHLNWYLRRIGLSFYRRQLVFYCRPPTAAAEHPRLPEGYEFRFIGAGELEALHYPGGWLRLPEARQWLERGDRDMLAAIRDGHICSYLWVESSMAQIDYLDLDAPLPPGHVYISKVLVLPQWRRHGLAGAMYRFFSSGKSGLTAHSACVTENFPMHMLFTKLGWGARLLLKSWKLAGMQRHQIESVSGQLTTPFLKPQDAAALLFSDPASRTGV